MKLTSSQKISLLSIFVIIFLGIGGWIVNIYIDKNMNDGQDIISPIVQQNVNGDNNYITTEKPQRHLNSADINNINLTITKYTKTAQILYLVDDTDGKNFAFETQKYLLTKNINATVGFIYNLSDPSLESSSTIYIQPDGSLYVFIGRPK